MPRLLASLCLLILLASTAHPETPRQYVSARMSAGEITAMDVTAGAVRVNLGWWNTQKPGARLDAALQLSTFAKQQGTTVPLQIYGESGTYLGRIENGRYFASTAVRPAATAAPRAAPARPIAQRAAPVVRQAIVYVSVSGQGERYHRWSRCPGLARSQIEARTLAEALAAGYDQCQECVWGRPAR